MKEQHDTTTKGNKMAKFQIDASYAYSGEIEADSQEEAEAIFLDNLNNYYSGTDEFEIEELDEEEEEEEE
jgi:hypothetical protein